MNNNDLSHLDEDLDEVDLHESSPHHFSVVEPDSFFEKGHRFFYVMLALTVVVMLTLFISSVAATPPPRPAPAPHNDTSSPLVVLVSLDAFAFKYLQASLANASLYPAPRLHSLLQRGLAAPLRPVFPSKTFPNHYTIVTGLYTESHGIVSNTMWDPVWNQTFTMATGASLPQWWGGEPLWVTAVRQGLRAGCMFWPGSDAAIDGVRPTYWHRFEGGLPYADRVANALGWLALGPDLAPQLVTLYFEAVDSAGHNYGPDAYAKIAEAVAHVDDALGMLLDGLDTLGLRETANVVVVSDHGMAEVSPGRTVRLDDFFDTATVRFVDMGVFAGLWPLAGESAEAMVARVYPLLRDKSPHMQAYTKDDLPERWHWAGNRRVAPLNVVAQDGYWVYTHSNGGITRVGGAHGYDNEEPDMQSILVAAGPAFRNDGALLPTVLNIDLYEMMTSILGLIPAPNNGTFENLHDLWAIEESDDE